MLQKKKLAYYAKQCGIEEYGKIVLSEADCEKICKAVGVPLIHARDINGDFNTLISIVMERPEFIEAHRRTDMPEDLFRMRCGDYAAKEVFAAYKS